METVDVHQHLLAEPLIAELARRAAAAGAGPPRATAGPSGSPGSPTASSRSRRPTSRCAARSCGATEIDRALVALSTALGIETLPAEEAAPLLEAHHLGIEDAAGALRRLGRGAARGARPRRGRRRDRQRLRRHLAAGRPPSPTPTRSSGSGRCSPGSKPTTRRSSSTRARSPPPARRGPPRSLPVWWPALTDYVAQMQAAWFAFLHAGRRAHPRLRVLFAMLAGGAPLQLERFAARGGTAAAAPDPLVFYDTSSYGPRMLEAMVGAVGVAQLVYGSDRPVVDAAAPPLDAELGPALLQHQPPPPADPRTGKETSHDRADRGHRAAARARPERRGAARRREPDRGAPELWSELRPPRPARSAPTSSCCATSTSTSG